jgi:tryptophan synthase alpha chain
MSCIEKTLADLKAQNRKALIPFVTAGFPYADITSRSPTRPPTAR